MVHKPLLRKAFPKLKKNIIKLLVREAFFFNLKESWKLLEKLSCCNTKKFLWKAPHAYFHFRNAFPNLASNRKPSKHAIDIIVYSYVFACRTIKPTRDRFFPRDVQFPVYRWWIAWKTIQRCWEIFYITKYISCNTTLMTINRHWKGWKTIFLYRVTLIDEHSPLSFQWAKCT